MFINFYYNFGNMIRIVLNFMVLIYKITISHHHALKCSRPATSVPLLSLIYPLKLNAGWVLNVVL